MKNEMKDGGFVEIKHSKEYEKGFRDGLKKVKMTKKEKYEDRETTIRRKVAGELLGKLKEILDFADQNDISEAMDRHINEYHNGY